MSCSDLTHDPVATAARAAATGPVSRTKISSGDRSFGLHYATFGFVTAFVGAILVETREPVFPPQVDKVAWDQDAGGPWRRLNIIPGSVWRAHVRVG